MRLQAARAAGLAVELSRKLGLVAPGAQAMEHRHLRRSVPRSLQVQVQPKVSLPKPWISSLGKRLPIT